MTTQITLQTKRLVLRPAQEDDAIHLHEAFSDAEVMKYWSSPPHPNLEKTQDWINGMISSPQNGITDFIICLETPSEESTPIGKIGIFSPRPSNEIGYILVQRHWRKGLMTEAMTKLIGYLFTLKSERSEEQETVEERTRQISYEITQLSPTEIQKSPWLYPSITADIDPRNEASVGLLKNLGFVDFAYKEKNLKVGEEWVDSRYLRLDREVVMGNE